MKMQLANTLKVFATAALLLTGTSALLNPIAATAETKRIAQSTMTAEMWYKQGRAKFDQQDYQGAIADYTQAIKLQPANPLFYSMRGAAQFSSGEGQSAIADYNQALKTVSHDIGKATILVVRGEAYDMLGEPKLAIADYQKAVDIYQKNNKSKEAQESSDKLKKLQSEIASQSKMTAETWYSKGDKTIQATQAIGYFNRAIKLNPSYAEAYLGRCRSLQGVKNYQSAIANCTQAITLNSTYEAAYLTRAHLRKQTDDLRGALADFTQVIKLSKSPSVYDYFDRAIVRSKLGDTQGAIADLQQVADLHRKNGEAEEAESIMRLIADCKAGSCGEFEL